MKRYILHIIENFEDFSPGPSKLTDSGKRV